MRTGLIIALFLVGCAAPESDTPLDVRDST